LWVEGSDDDNGIFEGHYDLGVGAGENFHINSRGDFPDHYLFRLPIVDCYLTKDHDQKLLTLGPKLTDADVKEIDEKAKLNNMSYTKLYNQERPSLYQMKVLYDQAIAKTPFVPNIQKFDIKSRNEIYYKKNIEAVEKLKKI